MNLTHLEGHETPKPLVPGQTYEAKVTLNDIAHRFAAGNRIRVALSTAYWPIIWPSPEVTRLTIAAGRGKLILPVRPLLASDADLPELPPAESAALAPRTELRKADPLSLQIERDFITGLVRITKVMDHGHIQNDDTGWRTDTTTTREFEITDLDPISARFTSTSEVAFGRDGMPAVTISVDHELTASRKEFHVTASMIAREDGEEVFNRKWKEAVPRNGV